jgi:hypothetical protein
VERKREQSAEKSELKVEKTEVAREESQETEKKNQEEIANNVVVNSVVARGEEEELEIDSKDSKYNKIFKIICYQG